MPSSSYTISIYPSGKSTFLLIIFIVYAVASVLLVGYLSNHPLSSYNEYPPTRAIPLLKEKPFDTDDHEATSQKPDFKKIKSIKEKKQAFFNYLLPMIRHLNEITAIRRENLTRINNELKENKIIFSSKKNHHPTFYISKESSEYLNGLAKYYKVDIEKNSTQQKIDKLLFRIDKIPASMILAQAANESAWGTSRFATEANNYFGQWCFRKGCGIIPKQRGKGKYHEVAKFKSVYYSVRSYFRNINTHRAYRPLRNHRAKLRNGEKAITGLDMITHLSSYSSRGNSYVRELRNMIKSNKLARHDIDETIPENQILSTP